MYIRRLVIIALGFGGLVNATNKQAESPRNGQSIPQERVEELERIIEKNDVSALEKLLESKTFNVNGAGLSYGIPFNFRVPKRQSEDDMWLVENKIYVAKKHTPLTFAAALAKPDIIGALIKLGAKVNQGVAAPEGAVYYPLYIGYSINYNEGSEREALIAMTKKLLEAGIAEEQIDQARRFVDSVVQKYDSKFAGQLRKLLEANEKERAGRPHAPGGI